MAKKASVEIYRGQRSKEKRLLWGRFVLRPIQRHFKEQFYALFAFRCFKCGVLTHPGGEQVASNRCIDHHLPMALGGHLEPGNLVLLCRGCNERKLDQHPADFYTQDELERLQPLLDKQVALFDFSFDEDAWRKDPVAYLSGLGIPDDIVNRSLYDELYDDYEGWPEPSAFTFTISLKL